MGKDNDEENKTEIHKLNEKIQLLESANEKMEKEIQDLTDLDRDCTGCKSSNEKLLHINEIYHTTAAEKAKKETEMVKLKDENKKLKSEKNKRSKEIEELKNEIEKINRENIVEDEESQMGKLTEKLKKENIIEGRKEKEAPKSELTQGDEDEGKREGEETTVKTAAEEGATTEPNTD